MGGAGILLVPLPPRWPADPHVLGHSLPVVVGRTQALPVRRVPEQRLIALVRRDMVDHRGHGMPAFLGARNAQRISRQVRPAGTVPLVTISALCSSAAPPIYVSLAGRAVSLRGRHPRWPPRRAHGFFARMAIESPQGVVRATPPFLRQRHGLLDNVVAPETQLMHQKCIGTRQNREEFAHQTLI